MVYSRFVVLNSSNRLIPLAGHFKGAITFELLNEKQTSKHRSAVIGSLVRLIAKPLIIILSPW